MDRGDENRVSLTGNSGRPTLGGAPFWNTDGSPTPDCLKLVSALAGMGIPKGEIAVLVGMSPKTFFNRAEQFPELIDHYEFGDAETGFRVANALVKKAVAGDMYAIRWYEMTRKGRAEKTESNITETQYVIEAPPPLPQDDWEKAFSPAKAVDDGTSP